MISIEYIDIDFDGRIEHVPIYNIHDFPFDKFTSYSISHDRRCDYINLPCAFDIETTTTEDKWLPHPKDTDSNKKHYLGFMYIWQFCLVDTVVMGRTWEEFQIFLDLLKEHFHLHNTRRLPIYVHYLAFEFQFMRNFLSIENIFARRKRVPIYVEANEAFVFKCSYFLSNMSLAKLIKNTPNAQFYKQSGDDFDYSKLRLPNTKLSSEELSYCYCDVRGLCEALAHYLRTDTISSMPLTSTGFLRRDCRKEVLSNPDNREQILSSALSPHLYNICKEASRGGNTHANATLSNLVLYGVHSRDRKSSYPAEMIVGDYPVSAFMRERGNLSTLRDLISAHRACLIEVTFHNISLKKVSCMPYISYSKCKKVRSAICDNGRISSAIELTCFITDIDFSIIESQYNIDEIEVRNIYHAQYGKLPDEFRLLLMSYFRKKEELNPSNNPKADPYLYAKFKNRINAFFGMMLTDICSPEIIYTGSTDEPWIKEEPDLNEALTKHYKSRKTFLSYQHGIWVTANARYELQLGLEAAGEDAAYCDTDSVKYIENHDSDFDKLNEEWLQKCSTNDINPSVTVNGKTITLGTWELDGDYTTFKTMGAKKYCYTLAEDKPNQIHITVAGLSKEKGAKYLQHLAKTEGGDPIDYFTLNTVIPEKFSGRTVAYYNDLEKPIQLNIENCPIILGSNIAVVNTTYKFGMSDDYISYLLNLDNIKGDLNNENYYNSYEEFFKQGQVQH